MNLQVPRRSLRFKLVFASVIVEIVLLTLLVANSQRLIHESLLEQTRLRLAELNPLLNAALAAPLAQRDFATLHEILQESQHRDGLTYLVLFDADGRRVAAAGWEEERPLPPLDVDLESRDQDGIDRFDTETPIMLSGQRYGMLRYGVATTFLAAANAKLLRQSVAIAVAEVLLSLLLLTVIGIWLTRHLEELARISRAIAGGDFNVQLPVLHTTDEVGEVTSAFSAMAEAIRRQIVELRTANEWLHAIANYTYAWENWVGADGKLLWVSPSVERLTGYTPDECFGMSNFPMSLVAPEEVERAAAGFRAALRGDTGAEIEFRLRRKDGSQIWASVGWQPIYGEHGENLGHRSSIHDISERKRVELALQEKVAALEMLQQAQRRLTLLAQEEQARLSHLLSAMNIGILFEDRDNRVMYTNPAFRRIWLIPDKLDLTGTNTQTVIQHSANVLSRPDHFSKHILQVIGTREVSESFEIELADGRVLTQLSYPVRDAEGRFIGRLWIYEDITRERQTAEQLIYLAERDSLTGLFNRHRFQEELGRMLADAERRRSRAALLFFDLDEFKYINDTFGHRAGDAMLIRVSGEVGTLVRRNEIVARLGGDEFAVLLPDAGEDEAVQLAERIIRAIAQIPFRFEQQNLRLTTSLGIALFPEHGADTEELVAHADTAMYHAKEAGKNAWRVYRPERDASRDVLGRLTWQQRIDNALEKDRLLLHFQAVYHAADRALSHLEVLVRMVDETDPSRIIMPGHFIGFAEKSGRIRDIDRWVLRESIKLLARSPATPPLAVNISGRSFDDPSLPQYIADQLAEFNVAPTRLLVELTETSAVSDLHDAQRFIEALRQTGCSVCLDDFGTGFSSFAYLKHLRADLLKIDGLFIRDLANDRDNQVFVKAIVDAARGMGKLTVAEFVEDPETLDMLKRFGVDMVQGYHLDMPRGRHPAIVGWFA